MFYQLINLTTCNTCSRVTSIQSNKFTTKTHNPRLQQRFLLFLSIFHLIEFLGTWKVLISDNSQVIIVPQRFKGNTWSTDCRKNRIIIISVSSFFPFHELLPSAGFSLEKKKDILWMILLLSRTKCVYCHILNEQNLNHPPYNFSYLFLFSKISTFLILACLKLL